MSGQGFLEAKFTRIGARLKLSDGAGGRGWLSAGASVRLDFRTDRDGEFFEIRGGSSEDARIEVLDVQPADRHLLLMVRQQGEKAKFLCGHDERHWFVAAVPESAPVGTVQAAKEALKPAEVRAAQARLGLGANAGNRRKNAAFRRQGEWFFIPTPRLKVHDAWVLRDEPITRGNGSKPHLCEFCFREGGELVYVCARHLGGVDSRLYRQILHDRPEAKNWGWQMMRRNPLVYARGRIRHPDHKTIVLHGWHRVVMNAEHQARAMQNVDFLD
jgi:hypothetical protein